MRRDLGFLKVSDYSQPFRLTRGHDDELTEHLKNLDSIRDDETYMRGHWHQPCSRYQYMKYYGAYVYTFHCLKNSQDAKNLESQILWKFYERYCSLPVGNGARSFRKE